MSLIYMGSRQCEDKLFFHMKPSNSIRFLNKVGLALSTELQYKCC